MKQVVEMPKGSIRYLGKGIQNELLHCLAQKLEDTLVTAINNALCFSLIMDTTQDITKIDQLSLVIRYAKVQAVQGTEQERTVEIKETFLGFYEVKDHSAEGMVSTVLDILKQKNIGIQKCYGQGYDGASVMSGVYNGVQQKIKNIQPNAEYVHCACHNLNLVVLDAVNGCKSIEALFNVLQNIYSFFGNSINRWDILSAFTSESNTELKKLNPTRWAGRLTSVTAVKLRYMDIIKSLTEIILKSTKKDEIDQAKSLRKNIETFPFVLQCLLMYKILSEINFSSKVLQKRNLYLGEAAKTLSRSKIHLQSLRSSYDKFICEGTDLAKKWGIEPSFPAKRQPKIKGHFYELASDYRFQNHDDSFKINIFYFTLDIVTERLETRFQSFKKLTNIFEFLEPKNILRMQEAEQDRCDLLQKKYSDVLNNNLAIQFVNAMCLLKDDLNDSMSVRDLTNLFLQKYSVLESDFGEVITALVLYLTLPVTVATAERSFSKLKIIKNYLRNSTILAIEQKAVSTMDIKDLVEQFAVNKTRKRNF